LSSQACIDVWLNLKGKISTFIDQKIDDILNNNQETNENINEIYGKLEQIVKEIAEKKVESSARDITNWDNCRNKYEFLKQHTSVTQEIDPMLESNGYYEARKLDIDG
jgi:hypothetical protein